MGSAGHRRGRVFRRTRGSVPDVPGSSFTGRMIVGGVRRDTLFVEETDDESARAGFPTGRGASRRGVPRGGSARGFVRPAFDVAGRPTRPTRFAEPSDSSTSTASSSASGGATSSAGTSTSGVRANIACTSGVVASVAGTSRVCTRFASGSASNVIASVADSSSVSSSVADLGTSAAGTSGYSTITTNEQTNEYHGVPAFLSGLMRPILAINPHHRHKGVYVAKATNDVLVTKNLTPGFDVYGEKKLTVANIEYRVWNPFRSKLAAGVLSGITNLHIAPGSIVLYLGASTGATVSHISDIVGPQGLVYAVEFSYRAGRDLLQVSNRRLNIVPIIEDARHPQKYRMIVGIVDTIFSDVSQPDQARIVAVNASNFLKLGGHYIISVKAARIDCSVSPDIVFASEVKKLRAERLHPQEQIKLDPYEKNHALVIGVYKPMPTA